MKRITLALTGASGMAYGLRLLECLLRAGHAVDLLASQAARIVARQELDLRLPADNAELVAFFDARFAGHAGRLRAYGKEEWFAPAASGSNPADAMVVCPCTMGSLAAIAHGLADNLIERAADVMLKERRPLILVPRETPFSLVHLRNMTALAEAGAIILPANPGFYHRPESVDRVVDFVVARVLDQLGVEHALIARWGDDDPASRGF
jgi:4-hydroxy-3-polyprenylbenzoate decarboxylase